MASLYGADFRGGRTSISQADLSSVVAAARSSGPRPWTPLSATRLPSPAATPSIPRRPGKAPRVTGYQAAWGKQVAGLRPGARRGIVSFDMEVRAAPDMIAFFRRLDSLGSAEEKKLFKKSLRKVARTSILPILRREVPKGTRTKYRPYRLRSTAQIREVFDDRVLLTVGSGKTWKGPRGGRYGLWTAAIVHKRWKPFMVIAARKAWVPFNRAMEAELRSLMRYVAKGSIRYGGLGVRR